MNTAWYAVGFALIVLAYFLVNYVYRKGPNLSFVSKSYMEGIVRKAAYFDTMNTLDLRVRSAGCIGDYRKKYVAALVEFSDEDKGFIRRMCKDADKILREKAPSLHAIPWKFVKIRADIENGYPHTLGDVIVLSDKFLGKARYFAGADTLIHEKVHVFQRRYPVWTANVVKSWGFIEYPKQENVQTRSNPDLPPGVWYGMRDGPIVQLYSDSPSSLAESAAVILKNDGSVRRISNEDVGMPNYISQLEHPYEIMACMVPEILKKKEEAMNDKELILYKALSTAPKSA